MSVAFFWHANLGGRSAGLRLSTVDSVERASDDRASGATGAGACIDAQLAAAGWLVQHRDEMNLGAGLGVAVREYPMSAGTLRLSPLRGWQGLRRDRGEEGRHHALRLRASQPVHARATGHLANWGDPLPFDYESTRSKPSSATGRDPEPRSRLAVRLPPARDPARLAKDGPPCAPRLAPLPPLVDRRAARLPDRRHPRRSKQSLAEDQPRSLIQMATGAGKTFTACTSPTG